MRAKRIAPDEQFRLITECRQSGLSDYQWCQMHDVNPGTFYNWISRLRKRVTLSLRLKQNTILRLRTARRL